MLIADQPGQRFRGRSRAKEFAAQLTELRSRVDRLGLLRVVELEARRASLEAETAALAESLERERADAAAAVDRSVARAIAGSSLPPRAKGIVPAAVRRLAWISTHGLRKINPLVQPVLRRQLAAAGRSWPA